MDVAGNGIRKVAECQDWWLTAVIPATQEAENGGSRPALAKKIIKSPSQQIRLAW
jgi:hypothetical protein